MKLTLNYNLKNWKRTVLSTIYYLCIHVSAICLIFIIYDSSIYILYLHIYLSNFVQKWELMVNITTYLDLAVINYVKFLCKNYWKLPKILGFGGAEECICTCVCFYACIWRYVWTPEIKVKNHLMFSILLFWDRVCHCPWRWLIQQD